MGKKVLLLSGTSCTQETLLCRRPPFSRECNRSILREYQVEVSAKRCATPPVPGLTKSRWPRCLASWQTLLLAEGSIAAFPDVRCHAAWRYATALTQDASALAVWLLGKVGEVLGRYP